MAPQLLPKEALLAGGRVRELLAAHRRAEDLINIGDYVQGSDPTVDEARARMGEILAFLQQETHGAYDPDEALAALMALGSAAVLTPLVPADEAFDPLPPGTEIVPAERPVKEVA